MRRKGVDEEEVRRRGRAEAGEYSIVKEERGNRGGTGGAERSRGVEEEQRGVG